MSPAPDACEALALNRVACNGQSSWCERPYNELAYATTHNSMSNEAEGWIAPNQRHNILTQLKDGIRALMIDTHYKTNKGKELPTLCHGSCMFGSKPLAEALVELEAFLRCNPNEVVTLIIEAYVSPEDTVAAFEAAGLTKYTYSHTRGQAWPTLGKMIADNRRLVVLSDESGHADWYMDVWAHAFETPFSVSSPEDLKCVKNRGEDDNALFILNHFLTTLTASEQMADKVNQNPFFITRAKECQDHFGQMPNFLTADFYSIGDVLEVTTTLNTP